jgi:hypothetical protein
VRLWLDRVIERRDAGKLIFADAFPGSSDNEKAYFAKLEGWQYGQVIPYQMQQPDFPQINEAPNLPLKTFW